MKRTFTKQEKVLVFDSWKSGVGFSGIVKLIDSTLGNTFTMLRGTGGIKPSPRQRRLVHLSLEEREEIRAGLSAKMSIRAIARMLNRSPSTISREVQRNRGRRYYKAVDANNRAWRMAKRPKLCLSESNDELRKVVLEKLELKWSPEQVSGWLKKTMPRRKSMHVSAETIYKTIYYRKRNVLHHSLAKHLRRRHSLRYSKKHFRKGEHGTINIVNGTSIHDRLKDIESKKSVGHWEGDLATGSKNTHIAILVDRKSRFAIILKLKGKDAKSVNNNALIDKFNALPIILRKSLTMKGTPPL